MITPWPIVKLGEVLHQRKEFVRIDDFATYKRCRVQLHAQGIVLRDQVQGTQVKTKTQQVCRVGDFLVAEIDAKVGGYGIVPPDLGGAIVSSHYFLFEIDDTRLDQQFLGYFARTPRFSEQVEAQGSTNYAAIRPSHVLAYEIPLPPIEEQRRIVARLDEVATQVATAGQLRDQQKSELQRLLAAAYSGIAKDAPRKPLGEIAPLCRRPVAIEASRSYPQVAVRSFGRGTFHKPALAGSDVSWEKLFLVRSGDILLSNIKAWEGAVAVAKAEDDQRVASHRYLTCVPASGVTTAEFVCFHLLSPEGLSRLSDASPGSADRNRTLGGRSLLAIPVPVPPVRQQQWFSCLLGKAGGLEALVGTTRREMDTLMPAALARAFRGEL